MPPKPDAAAELAAKMVHALGQQRERGDDAYPTTVARLVAAVDPQATPDLIQKALKKKAFSDQALLAQKKGGAGSPAALKEDADRLAASTLVLDFALGQVCTPEKPLHGPAKIAMKLDKPLRAAFLAALHRRLAENALPPGVGSLTVRNKPHLYLTRYPPPPPPKPPAVALAEKLVSALHSQRSLGEGRYPLTLGRLVDLADGTASPTVVKQALGKEPFKGQVLLAMPYRAGTNPVVALAGDGEALAGSGLLLESALAAVRTADNQAALVTDLKKKVVKALQQPFADALARRLETGALPPGIGCLRIKTKPYLFRLQDVNGTPQEAGPALAAPSGMVPTSAPERAVKGGRPEDFGWHFDEAFHRLDRERGSPNLVNLVPLRRALVVDRATFDAELQQLRRAGRYSLSAAEGRHGITPEEQEAGILEDGTLLLFVSRRVP
jgi:hypothetical protein